MRRIATLAALTLACSLHAAEPQLTTNTRIINEARSTRSKAFDTLEYLTDNIGPRLSGSKQAEAAVQWTAATLKSWGLDVRTESVMVPHWVRGVETGSLPSHMDQKIVLTALGGSIATPDEGITAEVVEVHDFAQLDALGEKVKGKIVLFDAAMDLEKIRTQRAFEAYGEVVIYRGVGASRAAKYGAVAALVRSVASASLRTPHTGSLRYEEGTKIPAAAVTTEDASLIHRLIGKGEKVTMHLTLTPRTLPEVESANVIAEIKGSTKPEEIVLLGGHLDSWDLGTGAIDDGSGVAMVMETMRILKTLNVKPKRTIRAVLYINEENGLRGGRGYAATHEKEIANHVAAIETDAGVDRPLGFQTTLKDDAIAKLRPAVKELETLGATQMNSTDSTGADTSPLTAAGVAGFGFFPEPLHYFDYHHTPADTLDKVDPKHLVDDSAAIAVLAWTIADAQERLPFLPPPATAKP